VLAARLPLLCSLLAVLQGCELVASFDRDKIPPPGVGMPGVPDDPARDASTPDPMDSGLPDAGMDAAVDAAAPDAGPDAGGDAGADAGATDAGQDAGADAGGDAGPADAGADAGDAAQPDSGS
jgi:carboxyl-terminal processing protease